MQIDKYGQQIYSEEDLLDIYLTDTNRRLHDVLVAQNIDFDYNLGLKHQPTLIEYKNITCSLEEFDYDLQQKYFMPESYKQMDIAKFILDLCEDEAELQRAGKELLMFQERNMLDFLRYVKYLVDTMRNNKIVWGVGRGSSVASFVLFLLGVHKINSLYYDLSIDEFLK